MKKLYLLSVMLMLALTGKAQEQRVWDFTKGFSQATIDAFTADENWEDGDNYAGKGFQNKKRSAAGPMVVNGEEIAETKGIDFGFTSAKHMQVVYNETSSSLPTSYLWFNGAKAEDSFTIHDVQPGEVIILDFQGHSGQDRGFKVMTSGIQTEDGSTQATSSTRTTVKFIVPDDFVPGDVKFQTTNGSHIYKITVGPDIEGYKIGYIYNTATGYTWEGDLLPSYLEAVNPYHEYTQIDLATADPTLLTIDSLAKFDALIITPAVQGTETAAAALKAAIAFVPVVNLSPNFYETWGVGTKVPTSEKSLLVAESARSNKLFEQKYFAETSPSMGEDGTLPILRETATTGIVGYTPTEGGLFAADQVLATVGEANAIHIHKANRNAYIMMPYTTEESAMEDNTGDFLHNALGIVAKTKDDVTQVAKPSIKSNYKDQATEVTISTTPTNATIYYTIDGTEPTTESPVYSGGILITDEGVIVKAFAEAEGYLTSEVVTSDPIEIKKGTPDPVINVAKADGKSTVTLTCADTDAFIYYNYSGSNAEAQSATYMEPIVITKPVTIYVFAKNPALVQSELVSKYIEVDGDNVRSMELVHMNSNTGEFGSGDIFAAADYYSTEKADSTKQVIMNEETGLEEETWVYTYKPNEVRYKDFGNGWAVGSIGQRINNQATGVSQSIGSDYGPYSVDDIGATSAAMSFLVTKNAADPASAFIETTTKYQAPFDVTVWVASQSTVRNILDVLVSTDQENWTKVGTLDGENVGKRVKKLSVSYDGTDEVYVRVASAKEPPANGVKTMIFDLVLYGPVPTGIQGVQAESKSGEVVKTEVYSVNGARQNAAQKGISIIRRTYSDGSVKTIKVIK